MSGAPTPGKSRPGTYGNEEVLCIPQSSSTTEASPSDCLVSYPERSLGRVLPQSVYSTAPLNWGKHHHHHVALPAWIFLSHYRPLLLVGLQGYVLCRNRAVSSWSSCLSSSMWRGPQAYVAYEFVLTSPAVSRMSGSSNLDSFHDGWLVAVQLAAFLCNCRQVFSLYISLSCNSKHVVYIINILT